MYVKKLKLINYRNYCKLEIDLNEKLNLFVGENAQGKTNLLESIYVSAVGKSYKNCSDFELVNFQKEVAYIGIEIESNRGTRFLEIKFQKGLRKRVRINKLEIEKNKEIYGNLNVVLFTPEDLNLIKDGPSIRRDFLDLEISQIKPLYRDNVKQYQKILHQRNRLLKTRNRNLKEEIFPWDIQLAEIGTDIIRERSKFIKELSKISENTHLNISGGKEKLEVYYNPSFNIFSEEKTDVKEEFINQLGRSFSRDMEKGITHIGPHKDEVDIKINGISSRKFGSQGQQRTAALSIKLSEIELVKNEIGEYPILLLDDVLSELDKSRQSYVIDNFKKVQTIVTATFEDTFDNINNMKKFYIKSGYIENL